MCEEVKYRGYWWYTIEYRWYTSEYKEVILNVTRCDSTCANGAIALFLV